MENARRSVEASGKTVDDAVQRGLNQLGLERSQVEIEIINEGRAGILGFGAEPARVRLIQLVPPQPEPAPPAPARESRSRPEMTAPATTPPAAQSETAVARATHQPVSTPPVAASGAQTGTTQTQAVTATPAKSETTTGDASSEATAIATETVHSLVTAMGYEARIEARIASDAETGETGESLFVDVTGRNLNNLIGQDGETLSALQFITRLIVNRKTQQWTEIVVDVDHYRQRRVDELKSLASRAADRVVRDGRPVSLQAMPANERRIIHLALRNHPEVMTVSIGQGDNRKVTIRQKS